MLGLAFEIVNVLGVTFSELYKYGKRLTPEEVERFNSIPKAQRHAEVMPAVIVAAKARVRARHDAGMDLLTNLATKAEKGGREAAPAGWNPPSSGSWPRAWPADMR